MTVQRLRYKLQQYALLIRLDRPIGIYLLLWPTLWALWIAAQGIPNLLVLVVFSLGVFLMRSAGCAINDYADRDIDPHVERTKQRPLAAGTISPKEALLVFATLSLLAFTLVLSMNTLTIMLSVGGVILAATYPFMKRYHHLPQVHLGAAFGWAIPMSFSAQTGELPTLSAWLLFFATLIWTTAYDTEYAMADREDDLKIEVKSSAILFGKRDRLIIGLLQLAFFGLMISIGVLENLSWLYYIGLALAAALAIYQQKLIQQRQAAQCFKAFLNNHYLGMIIFIGLALDYALR